MYLWTNDNTFWKKLGTLQLEIAQERLKMPVNTAWQGATVWGNYEKDGCIPMITISTQYRKVLVSL